MADSGTCPAALAAYPSRLLLPFVGWVERSETHHSAIVAVNDGFHGHSTLVPAISVIAWPFYPSYLLHLIEDRGLKKLQAICAVMRKLLHAIHGMLKTQQPFEGQRFYVLPKGA